MKAMLLAALVALAGIGVLCPGGLAGTTSAAEAEAVAGDPFADEPPDDEKAPPIRDPVRGMNRAFYGFNDKLYFWALRPVARGYKFVMPQIARVGVRNFFANVGMPARMVNCLLQADLKGTGTELARFGVNTTLGVGGFGDPAKAWLHLRQRDEDFGQTLGVWGLGTGWYLTWPIGGPSSVRDTVAAPVNIALDPATYLPGVGALRGINNTSLRLGDYEDLKAAALDPYEAIRDAYNQHRWHAVRTRR